MLVLRNVTKVYRMGVVEVRALNGVSLAIADGEFVAIMGPSGSGKSTLMNILGCLDTPTAGSYRLDGVEVAGLRDDDLATIRNQKIGFVFQSFNLLPRLSALEEVELPLAYTHPHLPMHERQQRAVAALASVGLRERLHHRPTELSGGEQQRVAIARALVTRPALILADEPTGNLDTKVSQEIMALLEALNAEGITIVFVTHEHDIAARARRVLTLRDGLMSSDERRAAEPDRPPATGTAAGPPIATAASEPAGAASRTGIAPERTHGASPNRSHAGAGGAAAAGRHAG